MGVLLLLKGQPGSGKSTLGRALASHLNWPLIDKDDARNAIGSLSEAHSLINWNSLSYDIMFRYLETQLSCGLSVILDCPLARRELYTRGASLAKQYNAELALIEVFASDSKEWSRRLSFRGSADAGTERSHKPGSLEDVLAIMKRNNGSETWSADDLVIPCRMMLDSCSQEENVDDLVKKVIHELQKTGLLKEKVS